MNGALYAVVSGSLAALRGLEITANNLANANTAGFKAQHLLVRSRSPGDLYAPPGSDAPLGVSGRTAIATAQRSVTDLSQGAVQESGNPLDVAITGPGFFVVTTPNGERYTRQGQFHLNATGTLINAAGYAVQGDGGTEISLPLGQIEIDSAGRVSVDGAQRAALRVVRFTDAEAVVPEGAALFAAAPEAQAIDVDPAETQLIQGSIENANVDVIKGLLELINVSRGYEAYMRAMQQVDGSIQMAIQQVGAKG